MDYKTASIEDMRMGIYNGEVGSRLASYITSLRGDNIKLRDLVEESFYEGYNYGMWDKYNDGDWTILKANLSWEESESKKELEE